MSAIDQLVGEDYLVEKNGEAVEIGTVSHIEAPQTDTIITVRNSTDIFGIGSEYDEANLPGLILEDMLLRHIDDNPNATPASRYWRAEYIYRRHYLTPVIDGGDSSLRTVKTAKLRDGSTPLTVPYGGTNHVVPADVDVSYTRLAYLHTLATENPDLEAEDWSNYVNSQNWHGGAPRQWKCVRVSWRPAIRGGLNAAFRSSWNFVYEFERADNVEGHVVELHYVEPKQGKVPDDATPGNGIAVHNYYQECDFATRFAT